MKHLLSKAAIAVMAAASMVGCSNESELAMPEDASNLMRFSLTQRNSSRGTATTSTNYLDQIQGFQVWGHYTDGATGEGVNPGELYVGESATVGTFIKGDGAGAWDYEDILDQQYWPATTAPLNFQAITPATDASFTAKITEGGSGARLCADVTVPTATSDQKDIMLAAALNQTRETNAQCVALTFRHAMSQVVFGARMASEKITAEIASIEIANVHAQGQVGFADDYSLYANVTGDAATTYSVGLDNAKTTLTTAATVNVTAADGALFMLPQTVPAWQTAVGSPKALSDADVNHNSYLKVRCTVTDNTSQTVLINDGYVYIPFGINWEQGKKYAYTLVFGDLAGGFDESGAPLENLLPVSYTVQEVEEWNAVDGGEFGIGGEIVVPGPDFSAHSVAGYAVTSTSKPTKLVNDLTGITEMWIEKVADTRAISVPVQIEPCKEYTFAETGNYKMYFKLKGTKIADRMFFSCRALTSVSLSSTLTTIGESAFEDCSALKEITIPEGVTSIGSFAFQNCYALTSVTLPSTLTKNGESAFYNCTSLKEITIQEGVTSIGEKAFQFCEALTSVSLPSTLTTIAACAFQYCEALTSIDIPEGVATIGDYTFAFCSALKEITLPSTLTTIGGHTFRGCEALTSIEIPEGVTTIGEYTFLGCTALKEITIPEGVTSIGSFAFQNCYALTSVTLSSTLTTIGEYAFQYCTSLASITCKAQSAPAIQSNTFSINNSDGVLTVPTGATGYDEWMKNEYGYLGYHNWTIQYSDEL